MNKLGKSWWKRNRDKESPCFFYSLILVYFGVFRCRSRLIARARTISVTNFFLGAVFFCTRDLLELEQSFTTNRNFMWVSVCLGLSKTGSNALWGGQHKHPQWWLPLYSMIWHLIYRINTFLVRLFRRFWSNYQNYKKIPELYFFSLFCK